MSGAIDPRLPGGNEVAGDVAGPAVQARHIRDIHIHPVAPAGQSVVPRELPATTSHFVGRAGELATLTELMDAQSAAGGAAVSVIEGSPGVGKTALAIRWAHQVAERFPDGQLYVNLRGFDPTGRPMTPGEALRGFLDAFRVAPELIPVSLDAKAARYRSILARRRVLVVVDNAADSEQVRPLLPGSSSCYLVVTSRRPLTGLFAEGARPVPVGLLTESEAYTMLASYLGDARVDAEPDAVGELIRLCAQLPLALAIAAARAAGHPDFSLLAVCAELRDALGRLDELDAGEPYTSVRTAVSWSTDNLGAPATRMFQLLSVHPGPDIDTHAAASLAALPPPEARTALTELARAHLVEEHTPGRFAFHDLLRLYATEQARAHVGDHERQEALGRVLDFYLHTAHTARLTNPAWNPVPVSAPRAGVQPRSLAGHTQALEWLDAEHEVLCACVFLAASSGFDTHAWQLPAILHRFFHRQGHWHDRAATWRTALEAADRLGDASARARAHRGLGTALTWLGDHDEAATHLDQALDLYQELDDQVGQAHAYLAVGVLFAEQERYADALLYNMRALELYRASGHRSGQAQALNDRGWLYALLGEHDSTLTHCQEALVLCRQVGDHDTEVKALDSIGYAYHHLHNNAAAVGYYGEALALTRSIADRFYEAEILSHLGDAQRVVGGVGAARESYRAALEILTQLGHRDADVIRAKLDELGWPPAPDTSPGTPASAPG